MTTTSERRVRRVDSVPKQPVRTMMKACEAHVRLSATPPAVERAGG